MVYGTSIKLPGEFFDPPTINMDPQNFVAKLQQHMAELKPLKSPSNRKQNIFVHKDLKSCSHVFLRIDRVKKALEPPYEGPYTVQKKVLRRILGVTYEVQDFDPVSRRRKLKDVVHVLCMKSYRDSTKQIETVGSQSQDIVLLEKKTNASDDYKGHVPE
ncbi:retrovirus-related Pol polyprotein from transposon opus [Trichonephila clavipes]|nr:retrovirus-related Pol polyprotein from transposon opus [Trichonephila clavipes]